MHKKLNKNKPSPVLLGGIILKRIKKVIAFILIAMLLIPCLSRANTIKSFGAVLSAPEDFSVEPYSSYNLLEWTNTNKVFTYILIERSIDQGEFYPISQISGNISQYKDYSITNGHIYTYRIKALVGRDSSGYSSEKEVVTLFPEDLEITNVFSDQINLKWDIPDLILYREIDYKIILDRIKTNENSWTTIATLPVSETSYIDTDVEHDTYYRYRIRMHFGNDRYSNYVPSSYGRSTLTPYALTTSLWGHGLSDGKIVLMWDMSRVDAGGKALIERTDPTGETRPLISSADKNTYIDTGLIAGETYTYRLCLLSPRGHRSEFTEEIELTAEYLQPPIDLTANPISSNHVVLTWNYPYEEESGFEIWRKAQDGPQDTGGWVRLATVPKNTDTYHDRASINGESYSYKIRAFRGDNVYSVFSPEISIINKYPSKPLPIISYTDRGYLRIFSNDRVPRDTIYTLEVKDDPFGQWKDIKIQTNGYLTYSTRYDTSTQLYYRIRANIDTLESYSEELLFFGSPPEAPSAITAPHVGYGRVVLNWTDETEKEKGYNIYRTIDGERTKIGSVDKDGQTFIDKSPQAGVYVYYEIRAFNLIGESQKAGITVRIPEKAMYKDIGGYTWAHKDIDTLQGLGAFGTTQNEYFYPQNAVTRGELAYMIMKSFNIEYHNSVIFPLTDITAHHKYYNELTTLTELGIMHPDKEGRIFPQRSVTRKEIIQVLNNVLAHLDRTIYPHDTEMLKEFTDYPQIDVEDMNMLASFAGEKIITGKSGQRLALSDYAAKIEATAFIYRTLIKYQLIG